MTHSRLKAKDLYIKGKDIIVFYVSNESISKEEEQYTPVVQILSSPFVWPGQGHCHLAYSLYTVKDAKAVTATTYVGTSPDIP